MFVHVFLTDVRPIYRFLKTSEKRFSNNFRGYTNLDTLTYMLGVRQSAIIRLFYLDEKWKKLIRVYLQISFLILSEFKKMFLFYSLRNHQKTYGFLVTSGGIEINSLTFA